MSINPGFHDMGQHCECYNTERKRADVLYVSLEKQLAIQKEVIERLEMALKVFHQENTCGYGCIAKEALAQYQKSEDGV